MKKSFFLGLAILMMWFMCVNGGYIECGGSGLYCPDSDTCCLDNGSWYCCYYSNAVCCPNGGCCPAGDYSCCDERSLHSAKRAVVGSPLPKFHNWFFFFHFIFNRKHSLSLNLLVSSNFTDIGWMIAHWLRYSSLHMRRVIRSKFIFIFLTQTQ